MHALHPSQLSDSLIFHDLGHKGFCELLSHAQQEAHPFLYQPCQEARKSSQNGREGPLED